MKLFGSRYVNIEKEWALRLSERNTANGGDGGGGGCRD